MFKYSLLAIAIPDWAVYSVVAVIFAIAFIIGFARGFTRSGWGASVWALAVGCWLIYEKRIREPGKPGIFGWNDWKSSFVSLFLFMAATFVSVGVFYGLLHLIKNHRDKYYLGERQTERQEEGRSFKVKKNKPNFISRLLGGMVSLVNCVVVLTVLFMIFMAIVPLYSSVNFEAVYEVELIAKMKPYIERYALDLLFAAVIMGMAYGGWRAGFLHGFRSMVHTVGVALGVVVCLIVPFKNVAFSNNMNGFFSDVIGGFVPEFPYEEKILPIAGKIASGIVLGGLYFIAFNLFCKLLQVLERNTKKSGPMRLINGVCGIGATMLQAVLLFIFIFSVLALLEYFGLNVRLTSWINDQSCFSGGFINFVRNAVYKVLDKLRSGLLI